MKVPGLGVSGRDHKERGGRRDRGMRWRKGEGGRRNRVDDSSIGGGESGGKEGGLLTMKPESLIQSMNFCILLESDKIY